LGAVAKGGRGRNLYCHNVLFVFQLSIIDMKGDIHMWEYKKTLKALVLSYDDMKKNTLECNGKIEEQDIVNETKTYLKILKCESYDTYEVFIGTRHYVLIADNDPNAASDKVLSATSLSKGGPMFNGNLVVIGYVVEGEGIQSLTDDDVEYVKHFIGHYPRLFRDADGHIKAAQIPFINITDMAESEME